jgi:hypothetical protein
MSVQTFVTSITPVPKTTFQHPSSTKLSMIAQVTRLCPSWTVSLATTKSKFTPPISTKPHSLPLGAPLHIVSCHSASRMSMPTFQWAMTYIFHDLAHIILAYLDDLTARSKKCTQHLDDLCIIFQRCRQYNILLNPLKCVFCVTVGRLLGFIVSQCGITVDPLKVQAITEIPPPQNLRQLQSLQGKANFLRRFVPDYATRAHGFLRLLRHDIPFQWDKHAQTTFDDLKEALSNTPLISPPDYNRDYLLYISASAISVAGVLIQIGDDDHEHVIYYISKNLSGTPLKYNHEENLALAVVLAVQKLRHYILLRTTKVIADSNPMQYCSVVGKLTVNLLDGSSSFRNTISNFQHPRERNLSSSPNSSRHFPPTLPVHLSIPTSPMNISFTSPRMTLGTTIFSSTSEHKNSETTSPETIVDVSITKPHATYSSVMSYIGEEWTLYSIDA